MRACCYTTGYKWTLCYPWMKNDLQSSEKWEVSDSQNEVILLAQEKKSSYYEKYELLDFFGRFVQTTK